MRGLAASAAIPISTALLQLVTVPLLLRAWGPARYGDWILLSTIPAYLALSDMGFGSAAGSDMTIRVAAHDRLGALRTFQTSWLLLTATSVVTLVLALTVAYTVPWHHWLNLSTTSTQEARTLLALLGIYAALCQQSIALEGGYRCDGRFAVGTIGLSATRVFEGAIATVTALITRDLIWVGCAFLAARGVSVLFYGRVLRRGSPWIELGVRHARMSNVRALLKPSMGFLIIAGAIAVSLQGYTVLVGTQLGPVHVVAFTTLRTLTRLPTLISGSIGLALRPALSAAFGSGDLPLARSLHRQAFQITLVLSLLCGAVLLVGGPFAYRLWTGHAVQFDSKCFLVLLAVSIINSLWYTSFAVPTAINTHFSLTTAYLVGNLLALVLGFALTPRFGMFGLTGSLLAAELWMLCIVIPVTLRSLGDNTWSFWSGLRRAPIDVCRAAEQWYERRRPV